MTLLPTLHTFKSQRLTLSYAEWGHPDAPLVFLVHGGRDQKRSWDNIARILAEQYRVIAHDLRGHGQSDWSNDGDYGVMDHVFDLASLIAHLDARSPIIIGHSLGGNIATRYTGIFPDRVKKLVSIEGLGPSPKMQAERRATPTQARLHDWISQRTRLSQRTPRTMASLEEAEARMRAAHSHLPEDLIHHLTHTGVTQNADGSYRWAYDPAGMGASPSDISQRQLEELWAHIVCPTWLVYGADSWASNPARDGRANHFSTARVSLIENAGHWLHHDQFSIFLKGLDAFLSG